MDKYDFSAESAIKEPLFGKMSALDAKLKASGPVQAVREQISFDNLAAESLNRSRIAEPLAESPENQQKPRERGL